MLQNSPLELLCWAFDGELEVRVGRGQLGRKAGGERTAVLINLVVGGLSLQAP